METGETRNSRSEGAGEIEIVEDVEVTGNAEVMPAEEDEEVGEIEADEAPEAAETAEKSRTLEESKAASTAENAEESKAAEADKASEAAGAAERSRTLEEGKAASTAETAEADTEEPEEFSGGEKKPFPVKRALAGVAVAAAVLLIGGAGYYIYEGQQYKTVFFPNTIVNGVDASGKTVDEVKALVSADVEGYELTVRGRNGVTDVITNDEIGLHTIFDGSLEQYLAAQAPLDWWRHRKAVTEYQIETETSLDEQMMEDRVNSLVFFDESQVRQPQDAYLSDYIPGEGYVVMPEDPGSQPDRQAVLEAVSKAVEEFSPELSLDEQDVYAKPAVTSDDEGLNARADELNKFVKTVITYQFGDQREELNGDTIVNWLIEGEDGVTTIDPEQVTAYVKELAEKYDTAGKPKELVTTYGPTVTITKGTYGWKIDQKEESSKLCELILAGESQEREPIYAQTANSHETNDYGNTYVEVNLTAQHLYYYRDGNLVIDSDLVSGSHARGHDTPTGAYPVAYKQRNRVLRGERRPDGSYEYESPVSYWMPFNGGIGLHDATWRGAFGGKIYMTNGSHGCVNLPKSVAKTIYENIDTGTPVLCYQLENTSGKAETAKVAQAEEKKEEAKPAAAKKPAAVSKPAAAPQPAAPPETAPAPETTAAPAEAANPGGSPEPGAPSQAPAGPGESAGPGDASGNNPANPDGGSGGSSDSGNGGSVPGGEIDYSGGPGAFTEPAAPGPGLEISESPEGM